jgi:hypothetical protein
MHTALALLAVNAALAALPLQGQAETVLEHHRRAVRAGDIEEISLKGMVVGRPSDNAIQLNISPRALALARVEDLDLVKVLVDGQTLPVRVMHASVASRLLNGGGDAIEDDDAVAALIVDDSGRDNDTTLVAYGGAIARALDAHAGMRVELLVSRYR